jgi:hypothetical protein
MNNGAGNGNMQGQKAPTPLPAPGPAPAPTPAPKPDPIVATPPPPPDPELGKATTELNAAIDQLREELLKNDPAYKAASDDKKASQAEVSALRSKEDPNPDAILAAAKRGLEASKRMTAIEKAAMAKDKAVVDAQAHLKSLLAAKSGDATVDATK